MDEEFGKHLPTRSDRHKKPIKPTKEEIKQYKQDKREHQKKEKQKTKGFFIEREIPEVEDVDSIWDDDPVREPMKIHPILSVLLILMLIAFGSWGGYSLVSQNLPNQNSQVELPINNQQEEKKDKKALEPINLLVIGCDEREGEIQARSDVIIVATLRPEDKKVSLFSIPRDTYVAIKGRGNDKINHAMAYGGVSLLKDTVENLLDMDIDYTVKINFDGFINVVDALGGVTVNVEQRMYKPLESIDLYPGEQTLMGKDALAFVRWRGATGDYGRIERQQEFMNALVEKLKTMSLGQALDLVDAVMDSVSTDMSVKDMATYGYKFLGINSSDLKTYSFIGEPKDIDGVNYVMPDEKAIKRIVDYMQNGEPVEEEKKETPQE